MDCDKGSKEIKTISKDEIRFLPGGVEGRLISVDDDNEIELVTQLKLNLVNNNLPIDNK